MLGYQQSLCTQKNLISNKTHPNNVRSSVARMSQKVLPPSKIYLPPFLLVSPLQVLVLALIYQIIKFIQQVFGFKSSVYVHVYVYVHVSPHSQVYFEPSAIEKCIHFHDLKSS